MKALAKLIAAPLVIASASVTIAHAHDMVPGAPQQQPIVVQGATLHTVTNGVLADTDLLFSDGKITAIGEDLAYPDNARVIDASGKHVYPGLIAMDTVLGLIEIEAIRASDDTEEVGDIHPEVSGHIGYNPDSEVIPTVRFNGITHAQVVPQGNLIMGRSSVLQLDGWTWEDAGEALNVGVHISWPQAGLNTSWWERRSPEEQREANAKNLQTLYDAIADAKAYYDGKQADTLRGKDIRWEAMLGLFDGSDTLYVHADDQRQITQALELQREYGFEMVIVGGRDAWRVADQIAEAGISVVFGAPYGLPTRDDESFDQAYSTPAQLAAANVDFAIAYPGFWDTRNLAFSAGNAVAYGLDKEQALAAITLKPAEIMGLDDRLGSLEVGKNASLIISSGDVLDQLGQNIEHMFIDGRSVEMNSRHKQLYEKYQQKPVE